MDTDRPLKLLFQTCAVDLLPLTGDTGAIVRHVGPVEIRALARRADCVSSASLSPRSTISPFSIARNPSSKPARIPTG
jgi:hypothetical protein